MKFDFVYVPVRRGAPTMAKAKDKGTKEKKKPKAGKKK